MNQRESILLEEYFTRMIRKEVLREDHNQLEIPFSHPNDNDIYRRPNYRHFLDHWNNIGKPGQLPSFGTERSARQYIDNEVQNILNKDIINIYSSDYGIDLDADRVTNYIDIMGPGVLTQDAIEKANEYNSIHDFVSDILYNNEQDIEKIFEDPNAFKIEMMDIWEYGFPDDLIVNDRGLIYCERALQIKDATEESSDLYNKLQRDYAWLGNAWSWKKGGAEPYCGLGGLTVILKAWASPPVIDWEETVIRNAYSLKEECEINPCGDVELFEVCLENGHKLQFKGPRIIKC